jgi:hypothetical protein
MKFVPKELANGTEVSLTLKSIQKNGSTRN